MFGAKMAAEGAKRRPRGASGEGLFLGLFFGPTFESNLGPKGKGASCERLPFLPPLTLSPLVPGEAKPTGKSHESFFNVFCCWGILESLKAGILESLKAAILESLKAWILESLKTGILESLKARILESLKAGILESLKAGILEVLSRLALACLALSCLVFFYFVLICLLFTCLVLFCLVLPRACLVLGLLLCCLALSFFCCCCCLLRRGRTVICLAGKQN